MSKIPERDAILVAGSAGFIGRPLLRRLAEQGRPVVSLYHAHLPEPLAHMMPIFADMLRAEHLTTALRNVSTVVHLAWSQSFRSQWEEAVFAQEGQKQDSRNILMVKNLVHAMEEAGTKRIIFVSALGASRHTDSWYLQEKYFAELVILNSKIPEKVILRSPLVFGEISAKDRLVTAVEKLMRFPWFYPVPKYEGHLSPIHVNDLCEILIRLIDVNVVSSAQLIEVQGSETLAIDEIFRFVSQGIGKGSHFALKGFLGAALAPLFEKIQRRKQENTPQLRDLLTVGGVPDKSTALNNPTYGNLPTSTRQFGETMSMSKNLPH